MVNTPHNMTCILVYEISCSTPAASRVDSSTRNNLVLNGFVPIIPKQSYHVT